jgi:hypothetical protein
MAKPRNELNKSVAANRKRLGQTPAIRPKLTASSVSIKSSWNAPE